MANVPTAFACLCVVLALAGVVYLLMCCWAAMRFQQGFRGQADSTHFTPPVSILRSVKGLDPQMDTALRSHCRLEYGAYEVLIGVSDANDPALGLVRQVQAEFPQCALRVVHCPQSLGRNGKVSNLAQMLPQARYQHVVINDSDIVVSPDYLRRVMAPFSQAGVGMVTTLFRGVAGRGIASRLEAIGISDFAGGVLVARWLEGGVRFALGATMATTKPVLQSIGGFESVADFLADDYELGVRTAAAGYRVELSDVVVETAIHDYSFRDFWLHQLRWARTVKDRRPPQYFGMVVTFALVWAVLGVVAAPHAWWSWAVLALAAIMRLVTAQRVGWGVLRDPQRGLWLLPLRDFVGFAVWLASFAGNEIEWRGQRFRLHKGRLEPL